MRDHLLISIAGILVVAVALAGLLGALSLLKNPGDVQDSALNLENGLKLSPNSGVPDGGLGVKGPVNLPEVPVFKVSGATGVSYLRTMVGEIYTGASWLPAQSPDASYKIPTGADISPPDIRNSDQCSQSQVEVSPILPLGKGPLPIPLYMTQPQGSQDFSFDPSGYGLTSPDDLKSGYSFQALTPVYSPDDLRQSRTTSISEDLLQLPDTLPQRVRDLAQDITQGQTSDYEKLQAIKDYLQRYTYDLDNTAPPSGQDGVDYFLFEDKRGVCSTFSSAFAVLSRAAGIPARVVGGWAIAPAGPEQVIKANQAHQWAEVPFEDLGWVTFDPTPGGPVSRVPGGNPSAPGPVSATATPAISAPGISKTAAPPGSEKRGGIPSISTPNTPVSPDSSTREPTVTEITAVDPVVHTGTTFTVSGTVKAASGTIVNDIPVEIFINPRKAITGGVRVGEGTVTRGNFSLEVQIHDSMEVGNYQLLAHSLGNSRYKDSWSDPQIKVVTDTLITLDIPERVKESEAVTLQGKLTRKASRPIPGQRIDIFINAVLSDQLATDLDGQFQWKQAFSQPGESTVEARYPGTEFQLQSSRKAELRVLIPTVLKLEVQGKADTGDSVVISGRLLQEKTGISAPGQPIELRIDGQPLGDKLLTDQNGVFSTEHTFNKPGKYQIKAVLAGNSSYWESEAAFELTVDALSTQMPAWLFPVIGATFVAVLAGGFFFFRWLKRRSPRSRPSDTPHGSHPGLPPPPGKSHPGYYLKIEFPQIRHLFPHVWGVGDELEIACHLLNRDGDPLEGRPVTVAIGQEVFNATTDKNGTAKLRYTFTIKGEFPLAAVFSAGPDSESVRTECRLRIVDYREEIVDLFKSLLGHIRSWGIEIALEATPREIQRAALTSAGDLSEDALESTVSYFEEANFSLHSISRQTYEEMYLAQNEIKEYERRPANK